jgi:hypothetical protein
MAGTQTIEAGASSKNFQVGYEKSGDSQLSVGIDSITSSTLGLAAGNIATATDAYNALATIDAAVSSLGHLPCRDRCLPEPVDLRQRQPEHHAGKLQRGRVGDPRRGYGGGNDELTKNQILVQAGTAMLAQPTRRLSRFSPCCRDKRLTTPLNRPPRLRRGFFWPVLCNDPQDGTIPPRERKASEWVTE